MTKSRKTPAARTSPTPAALLAAASKAADASARVLMHHFRKSLQVREKGSAGLVTQVDVNSEKEAMKVLRRATPEFGFLTEESGVHEGRSSRGRWILDPLDGTTNYIHGFPMFCVSIAAEWDGEIVAGVIYHPVLKDRYTAVRGKGAHLNGKKLRVSKTKKLEDSLLSTGFTYRKNEWLHREMEAFERLSGIARAVRRPGSAAMDLAFTAAGVFDAFWERRLSPWDIAAGMLLVEEAGGKMTNFAGTRLKVEEREVLASNGLLHDDLLATIEPKSCAIL